MKRNLLKICEEGSIEVRLLLVQDMVYLPYIQVILSILVVAGVLLQRSEAGLGAGFGGEGGANGRFMRRGFEKLVFNATIVVAILFALSALVPLFLSR